MGKFQSKEIAVDRHDHSQVNSAANTVHAPTSLVAGAGHQLVDGHFLLSAVTLTVIVLVIVLLLAKFTFDRCVYNIIKGLRRQKALDPSDA